MNHNDLSNNQWVSIQKSTYKDLDIDSLLAPFGGMKHFIKKGDRVLLKVNLLNASTPEKAIVTHPSVVSEVAKSVLKASGVPFIGDSPSGPFTKRRLEKVYENSGMKKVASDLGIELNYDTSSSKVKIPNGRRLKKTPICNFFLEADKTIALPKLKTHSYMIMTLATKIMYGIVPGLTKARYHSMFMKRDSFADMLLDLLLVASPDLFILDGVVGMDGNGPAGGTLVDLGVMFASTDAVAMDLSVCRMLGIEPVGVPILKRAKIRKMWPKETCYPLLSCDDMRYDGFILPSTAGYALTGKKKPKRSPVPNEKCTGCKDCVRICPRKAIRMVDERARVDYSKCIHCYCCHEVCPDNAISLEVLK